MKKSSAAGSAALSITLFICTASIPGFALAQPCPTTPGDLDGSSTVSVLDVPAFINCLLGTGANCGCADTNGDASANGDDVASFIGLLLGGSGPVSQLRVDIEISGMAGTSANRCITFELSNTAVGGAPVVVRQQVDFVNGRATGVVVAIPPGTYNQICAFDPRHTVKQLDNSARTFRIVGNEYVADFTGNTATGGHWLINGNINGPSPGRPDAFIDILDDNAVTNHLGENYGNGNSNCTIGQVHADLNGDGQVTVADQAVVRASLFTARDNPACASR